jgi:hypothetical protein
MKTDQNLRIPENGIKIMKSALVIFSVILLLWLNVSFRLHPVVTEDRTEHPRIINIINFIRLLEPRDGKITEDVLYQTVVEQLKIMRKYKLGGTFLLQYDALIDPRYQNLLKTLPADSFEIGGWWEIPQPLVEKAGMKWRGRYPWDWHANVGFSTGYTPEEREKLIDVYMADFRKIFGYYPESVGSWFIDIHSLNYMYEKYHIVASCNCKDQSGTDGYTVWGGYWNQAYYPSKKNAYMPAQNVKNQVPVPVFRMLGSDPVRQYDTGIGSRSQGVVTLEPVYPRAGGNEEWVNWYFREFVEGACMEFAYVQAGQENSFTWKAMEKGYEIQMPIIAGLRDHKKVKVQTMSETGRWFKNRYKVTPATSVTVTDDLDGSNFKTVWFNSRFYRANFFWEDSTLRIRDIHLFDEDYPSLYAAGVTTTNQASFFTLPFVDGYFWSNRSVRAGLKLKAIAGGEELVVKGAEPVITDSIPGVLHIVWPLKSFAGNLLIDLDENDIQIRMEGNSKAFPWYFELTTAEGIDLPFREINPKYINCQFDKMNYRVSAQKGTFSRNLNAFTISPEGNSLVLKMDNQRRH